MEIPVQMIQARDEASTWVLPIEGVYGIDIGLDATGEHLALRIVVADPSNPPHGVPESVSGFPVVLIAGAPRLEHTIPDVIFHVAATGGIEVGRRTPHVARNGELVLGGGTLGMIFRDRSTQQPVALSCAHVLCGRGAFTTDDPIHQPAPRRLSPPASERLGVLKRWIVPQLPPLFGTGVPSGFADAAICSVERGFTGSEVEDVGMVTGLTGAHVKQKVQKRGKTTGLTFGEVEGVFGSYLAHDDDDTALWYLLGQIRIKVDRTKTPSGIWSRSGDSGSIILDENRQAVAMHWGGNEGIGYATDIFTITTALDLTMG